MVSSGLPKNRVIDCGRLRGFGGGVTRGGYKAARLAPIGSVSLIAWHCCIVCKCDARLLIAARTLGGHRRDGGRSKRPRSRRFARWGSPWIGIDSIAGAHLLSRRTVAGNRSSE